MFTRFIVGAATVAALVGLSAPLAGAEDSYQRPDLPDKIECANDCTYFGKDHLVHADIRELTGDGGTAPEDWDLWLTSNSMSSSPSVWGNRSDNGNGYTVWGMPSLITNSSTTTTATINVWDSTYGLGASYLPSGSTRYFQSNGSINSSAPGVASVFSVSLRIKPE